MPWAVHVPGYDDQVPDAYNYVDKDKDGALQGDPIETVVHGDGDILVRTMDEEKRALPSDGLPYPCMRGTYELVQPFDERRQAAIPAVERAWAGVVNSTVGAPITLSILSSRAITRRLASSS